MADAITTGVAPRVLAGHTPCLALANRTWPTRFPPQLKAAGFAAPGSTPREGRR